MSVKQIFNGFYMNESEYLSFRCLPDEQTKKLILHLYDCVKELKENFAITSNNPFSEANETLAFLLCDRMRNQIKQSYENFTEKHENVALAQVKRRFIESRIPRAKSNKKLYDAIANLVKDLEPHSKDFDDKLEALANLMDCESYKNLSDERIIQAINKAEKNNGQLVEAFKDISRLE